MTLDSLLVSRDSDVVRVLQTTLDKLSIAIEVSAGARSGGETLAKSKYDAVIVDCDDLQGGVEVLRSLRKTASNKSAVSFAILNGKTTTQQAFEMGANFVLQKPLTSSTAIRCFNAAMGFMVRERRRYFRCAVEARVVLTLPHGEERPGVTTNISEGGMAVRLEHAATNTLLPKVRFTLPGTQVVMEPKGEIVWADGKGRAGIRFLEVPQSSQEQLERWILRRLESRGATR
jgi:CheY-like chemotaxis protein